MTLMNMLLLSLLALMGGAGSAAVPPKPTAVQQAWINREIGGLVTWSINVNSSGVRACSGCNWGLPSVPDPADFNPTALNMTKWAEAAVAFGAKSLVFAVNHCTGFAMWPSNVTMPSPYSRYNFSAAYSGPATRGRDLLAEFVAACKVAGIKPGVYLNLGMNMYMDVGSNGNPHSVVPSGRNQICWDPKGFNGTLLPGQAKVTLAQYQAILVAQMEELLGGTYGHGFGEIWLDGGYPADIGDTIATLIDANQPSAVTFQGPGWDRFKGHAGNVVRWAGTESGHTPDPDMWSTVDDAQAGPGGTNPFGYGAGDPDGGVFFPAEQDAAIQKGANEGGFWYPGETPKDVGELLNEYEDSIGHNSNFMLELSPDRDGAVPAADLAAYVKFGAALERCYTAKAVPAASTTATCATATCTVNLPLPTTAFDRVRIAEAFGTRAIRGYVVEARAAGDAAWTTVAAGKSIGHSRIHRLSAPLAQGSSLRMRVTNATTAPALRLFAAYNLWQPGGCAHVAGRPGHDHIAHTAHTAHTAHHHHTRQ